MKKGYVSPEFEFKRIKLIRDVLADSIPEPTESIGYNDPVNPEYPDLDPFA